MFDAGFKLGLLVTNVQNPKRQKVISSLSPKEWFEAQTSKLKFHETDVYLYFCHDRPAYVSYVTHPCCPCRWFCPRGALFHSPSGTAWRFSGICWALSGVLRLSRWDRRNVHRCPHSPWQAPRPNCSWRNQTVTRPDCSRPSQPSAWSWSLPWCWQGSPPRWTKCPKLSKIRKLSIIQKENMHIVKNWEQI